ncbi:MAG: tetratricopeptide repeat protein, partial [Planctomycetaceae bacterium]
MALDLYDPCPCGSGRKLKFCCRDIVPDMERVLKFQENNRPRMALNAVDEVAKKHPENSWVRATRGGLYFDQGNLEEAHREFAALVAVDPE